MHGSWNGAPGTGRPDPLVTKSARTSGAVQQDRRARVLAAAWKAMAAFSRSVPSSGNQTGSALWTTFVMSSRDCVLGGAAAPGRAGRSRRRRSRRGRGGEGRRPIRRPRCHVERGRGHALSHRGLDAGQPEREAGVPDALGSSAEGTVGRVRPRRGGVARSPACARPRATRAEHRGVARARPWGTTMALPGDGAIALPGSGTTAGMGVPADDLAVRQRRAGAGVPPGRQVPPRASRPAARRASAWKAPAGPRAACRPRRRRGCATAPTCPARSAGRSGSGRWRRRRSCCGCPSRRS